jgi:hypothetical protein
MQEQQIMNHKRRKSRRSIRCTLCTPHRWRGNSKGRFKAKDHFARMQANLDARGLCAVAVGAS